MKLSEVLRLREALKTVQTHRTVYSVYYDYTRLDGEVVTNAWAGWTSTEESCNFILKRYEHLNGRLVKDDGHTCPICRGIAPDMFGLICPDCSGRIESALAGEAEVVDDEEIEIPRTKEELLAELEEAGDEVIRARDRYELIKTTLEKELARHE